MPELHSPSTRKSWWLGGLLIAFYPMLGFKRAFSLIGFGLAIYGIFLLIRRGKSLFEESAMFAALFVAIGFALPLLLALPDAAFPMDSIVELVPILLYLPIMIAVIVLVQEQKITRPVLLISIVTVAFWALDGLVQLGFGRDIFGMPYNGERVGAYWLNQYKFGYYMGFYGLFAVTAFAVCYPRRPLVLIGLWIVVALGVLIGGNREAWIMFFLFSGVLFWVHIASLSRYRWLWLMAGAALIVLLMLGAYEISDTVRDRIGQSLSGLQWSYESIDRASSSRLELWRIAVEMIQAHPLNGQGLNAYQSLFTSLVQQPAWVSQHMTEGPFPHQLLLEVGAATGILGWLGLVVIVIVVRRAWLQASKEQRALAWPALIYLMALWFPLNTHRSFYSSELVMGNLLMMGLILGNLLASQKQTKLARVT